VNATMIIPYLVGFGEALAARARAFRATRVIA
jgi:hypothetical protein